MNNFTSKIKMNFARIIAIHGEMRGSIGGNVYSANRGGSYVKQRTTPVQPNSTQQIRAKAQFGVASQQWAGLSAEQKQSYRDFAGNASRFNPIKRMNTGNQSGNNAYTSLTALAAQCSQAVVTSMTFVDDGAVNLPYTGYLPFAVPVVAPNDGQQGTLQTAGGIIVQISLNNVIANSAGTVSFEILLNGGVTDVALLTNNFISGNGKNTGFALFMSSYVGSIGNRPASAYNNMVGFWPPVNFNAALPATKLIKCAGTVDANLAGTKYGFISGKVAEFSLFAVAMDGTGVKVGSSQVAII